MYGNRDTAKSCDAMLCESMVGAQGSTGNIPPASHTIDTLPFSLLLVFSFVSVKCKKKLLFLEIEILG